MSELNADIGTSICGADNGATRITTWCRFERSCPILSAIFSGRYDRSLSLNGTATVAVIGMHAAASNCKLA